MAFGMMAAGAAIGLAGSLIKKKPKIPTFKKVDQAKAQQEGIAANLASFSQAKQLADQTTGADQDRLDSMLSRVDPNNRENRALASANIGDMMRGKLSLSDFSLSLRRSAEGSSSIGLAGSQGGRFMSARDLGRTEFDLKSRGLNAFDQFSRNLRQNYTVNPMSTAFSYTSTPQYIQNEVDQNKFAYNAAVGKAQSDAANHWSTRVGNFAQQAGGMMAGAGMQKWAGGLGGGGGRNVGGAFGSSGIPLAPEYKLPAGYAGPTLGGYGR